MFYAVSVGLALISAVLAAGSAGAALVGVCGIMAFGLHLWGQVRALPKSGIASEPLFLFKSNQVAGLILVGALLGQALLGWALSVWSVV